jgi:hypothetical protein
MSDNSKFYKLASVVDNYLIESDLPSGWFGKCLVWAIRGLRESKLDTWNDISTRVLDVNDRGSVVLPNDFVDWAVVSAYSNGRLQTLGINNEISTLPKNHTAAASPTAPTQFAETHQPQYHESGYYLTNFHNGAIFSYGLALSSQGRFRVHDTGTCKELLMDLPGRVNEIYLEYITDGFDPCGETYIHPYLYDYLMKYMDLKYEEKNNPKATEASIFRKSEDLFYAEKRVRARRNNLDPQTLINLARQHTTLALKV